MRFHKTTVRGLSMCLKALLVFNLFLTIPFLSIGQNTPPTGGNEYLSIMENQSPALIGNLLINNFDADGDPLSILNITNTVNGAIYVNLNNGFINYYTLPEFCGIDTIRYAVSDGNFIIYDTLFLTINCVNNAPSQGNETLTVQENSGTTNTVDLLANNIDPEGDLLTIISMQTPLNGTLTANGDGTYAYTPNTDYCGTEVLAYVVSDGVNTVTDYLTINVICQNDPPTGGNEYMTIDEDGPMTNSGSLLANNSDPEGNTLTILSITSTGGGVYFLTPSGSVNYTPNPDWCGVDTLTYTVTDGANIITDTLFVTVICINDLPTNGNEWIVTDTDVAVSDIDVLANNFDVENGVLSIASPSFPATTSAGGTVTINADNTLNYTPPAGFMGYDTLIYQVCDDWVPDAGCVYDTLFITVSIDADGDGVIDLDDIDSDNDGIPDLVEQSTALNGGDTDGDGIPDHLDLDSDNDGIFDIIEAGGVDVDGDGMVDNMIDLNGNGMSDYHEMYPHPLPDTDGDGLPDYQDVDDDGDGILTIDEYDANEDGIVDDCNGDGLPDYLDPISCNVWVPEVFTPNWDGKNDVLVINGIFAYPENEFKVYNRWGTLVFKSKGYQNSWAGTNDEQVYLYESELPDGTYFYVLDLNNGETPMKGFIQITR
jgi:gliding motility-associated-like protein